MTLFDPDDYLAPGAVPKVKHTRVHRPPEVFPALASHTWRLVQQRRPGIIHAQRGVEDGAYQTWCGVYAVPLTFDQWAVVNACVKCRRAMQAFGRAV